MPSTQAMLNAIARQNIANASRNTFAIGSPENFCLLIWILILMGTLAPVIECR
jgi:hypothetical protein